MSLTEAAAAAAAPRGGDVWSGKASQAPIKAISYSSHTRIELRAAAARRWAAAGRVACGCALRLCARCLLRVLLHAPREIDRLSRFGVCAEVSPQNRAGARAFAGRARGPVPGGWVRERAGRAPTAPAPFPVPELLGLGARPGRKRPESTKSGKVVTGSK